ncbi:MAG: helix-turn-helix transcriptional regulator [Deltaproteobacteria bacterium]|nr:helix-turn-helix transcriptional regulator [Deltaproteobacteria bacterium]
MPRNFKALEAQMAPERLARAEMKAKEILADMLLAEIRKQMGLTQEQLAKALNIKQPTLSKIESQGDMQIGTLRRIIEALGGELELIAHLPGGDVRLSQFHRNVQEYVSESG